MPAPQRGWTTQPGELLIEPCDIFNQATILDDAMQRSGLDALDFVSSKVVTVAIPELTQHRVADKRCWPDVNPEALANPLFWLPVSAVARYITDDGQVEPDDMWAARIALLLESSGLYDTATGTWVDILAAVGVDIDTEAGKQRVIAWQAGADDSALDSIDLTETLDEIANRDDGLWLAPTAAESADRLIPIAGLHSATSMRQRLATAGQGEVPPKTAVEVILQVAQSAFDHLDGEPGWWAALSEDFTRTHDLSSEPGSVIGRADERLAWIEETYLPLEEAVMSEGEALLDSDQALEW